jgi:hypothetical protein
VDSEQIFDTPAQLIVVAAGAFQKNFPLIRWQFQMLRRRGLSRGSDLSSSSAVD